MSNHKFAVGFIVGLGSVWLWHHFVSPLPGAKG